MDQSPEWILTNSYKADLIAWMSGHPEVFDVVVRLSLTGRRPVAWRAAWLLWSCMEDNDERVQPYVAEMISTLGQRNDDQQREFLIILHKMKIPGTMEGMLFDRCTEIWGNTAKKPAVRMNALKLLVRIAASHPGLQQELLWYLQPQYLELLSPAARKSVARLFREVKGHP